MYFEVSSAVGLGGECVVKGDGWDTHVTIAQRVVLGLVRQRI
jgi:hypothetical protein